MKMTIADEFIPVIEKEIDEHESMKEYSYEKGGYHLTILFNGFGYFSLADTDALKLTLHDKEGILNIQSKIGD